MLITTGSERVNRIGGHTHLNDFNFKTIFLNKILLKYQGTWFLINAEILPYLNLELTPI